MLQTFTLYYLFYSAFTDGDDGSNNHVNWRRFAVNMKMYSKHYKLAANYCKIASLLNSNTLQRNKLYYYKALTISLKVNVIYETQVYYLGS